MSATPATEQPPSGSLVRWSRHLDPPQWLLLALLAAVLLHLALPGTRLVPRDCFWGCLAVAVLGFLIAQLAVLQMQRAGTPFECDAPPHALLTGGLFGRSRNPIYVGMLLLLAGEAAMLGTMGALLPLPLFYFGMRYGFVKPEERALHDAFGASYLEYRRRVRRWL